MELNCDFQYVLGKDRRTFYMGLAMLWVIGYHVYLHDQGFYDTSLKVFRNLFKYGYVGVDLFLFFSAYGLCHSWMRSSIKDFYVKRLVRIVPIFLLYGLVRTFLQSESLLTFLHHSLLEVTSLSLIQTPLTCPGKLSLDWFVPAILNLYILFPLFYRLIRKLYRRLPPPDSHLVRDGGVLLCSFFVEYEYHTRPVSEPSADNHGRDIHIFLSNG